MRVPATHASCVSLRRESSVPLSYTLYIYLQAAPSLEVFGVEGDVVGAKALDEIVRVVVPFAEVDLDLVVRQS